tara:strand:- start:77 stop:1714 length:1638 start_codon:yes stop_codon:yes gene_type:complete
MRRKKILFCSEASWLATGYSVYTKEVLSRLNQIIDIEVAELACYADRNDHNIQKTPWKVFPNKPLRDDSTYSHYMASPSCQFGEQAFNSVLLDFQPDIVIDIRDWWMVEFEQRSPFRDFFTWAIMPTVDAKPQAVQWINTYASADAVFSYSEFGRDTLLNQCDAMKFVDTAPPCASQNFVPVNDKQEHKSKMGIQPSAFIIGTVMRNQKRKLYPDLLRSFRDFIDNVQDPNIFLYCHTYYPDVGWDLPALMQDADLGNRILFTYRCQNCKKINIDFFKDSVQYCSSCQKFMNQIVGINNPVSEIELAQIYNLFDLYVQYANSEGFGMPQLEAAQCAVPIISTYYSAMESVIDNIGGIGIPPLSYYIECETGCERAIPDNKKFVDVLVELYGQKTQLPSLGQQLRANTLKKYNWDDTANVWAKYISTVEVKDIQQTWLSPPKIIDTPTGIPDTITRITDKVNFIFTDILAKPEWVGGYFWKKVLKDITFGYRCENLKKDFYFNESHLQSYGGNQPFNLEDACREMHSLRTQINQWEKTRHESLIRR